MRVYQSTGFYYPPNMGDSRGSFYHQPGLFGNKFGLSLVSSKGKE
jgi:hypothetical protein